MGSIKVNLGFQGKTADTGFRYRDLSMPISPTVAGGDLKVLKDMECIKQSLSNLFSWKKGERVLQPEYGNPLFHIIDEPMSPATESKVRDELTRALERWEPRVVLTEVNIVGDADDHTYYIEVKYSIPSLFDKGDSIQFAIG